MREFSKSFHIGKHPVGEGHPPLIIAEAGVAHFGSIDKAIQLVDVAVDAGAHVVKFQIFDVNELIANDDEGWKSRLGPRQLTIEEFKSIKAYCKSKQIEFMATAHDEKSFEELLKLSPPALKIGSGERGNFPFLKKIFQQDIPVILSTGMYEMEDIRDVLDLAKKQGKFDLAILHCVTRYPTPPEEANLSMITSIAEEFNVITGYSDHTEGTAIPISSVALGAKIIEKHISIDFDVPNAQDWKVSCGPHNFSHFVRDVLTVHNAVGTGEKVLSEQEINSRAWATKSIFTSRAVREGQIIRRNDLVFLRPGGGISPKEFDNLVGKKFTKNLAANKKISWNDIK